MASVGSICILIHQNQPGCHQVYQAAFITANASSSTECLQALQPLRLLHSVVGNSTSPVASAPAPTKGKTFQKAKSLLSFKGTATSTSRSLSPSAQPSQSMQLGGNPGKHAAPLALHVLLRRLQMTTDHGKHAVPLPLHAILPRLRLGQDNHVYRQKCTAMSGRASISLSAVCDGGLQQTSQLLM